MDNRVFNVNGSGEEMLRDTLSLAMTQSGASGGASGWEFMPDKGFVLYSYGQVANKFPTPLTAAQVAPMVHAWLESPEARGMKFEGWDADCKHDGDNVYGWRAYCENWGHVAGKWGVICAIRPAFLWYGK
jgi:hypothetical protein